MTRNTFKFRVPFDPCTEVASDHVPEEEILPWYPELTADRLGRLLGAMDNDVQIDRGNADITYPMDQMVGPSFNDRITAEDMDVNLMLNKATLSRAATQLRAITDPSNRTTGRGHHLSSPSDRYHNI